IFSAFTFAYAALEIPAGWLADRFGPRLMLTRVVVWWSLLTAATGLTQGFVSLLIVRFLFGAGEAGVFPGLSRVFSRWLPSHWHGNAFGLAVMTALLGGAATNKLTAALLQHFYHNWRIIFFLYGMVGLVWAAVWFWWFRDEPHQHRSVNAAEIKLIGSNPTTGHPPVPWRHLLNNRALLLLCGMYFSVIYGWYFFLTWMPKYLLKAREFDLKATGWFSMLPMLCMAVGVFLGGFASDQLVRKIGRRWGRRIPGLIGLPLAAGLTVIAVQTTDAKASAYLFAIAAGLATFGVAPGWAACLDIGGQHAGVVTGTMNTFGNLGGTAMPLFAGYWLEQHHSWTPPLLSVAALYLVAAICWLAIDAEQSIQDA
ncbi:MAG: hypothetical protein RLY20_1925, partial [Verrucomicrobiota bacterium]